MVPFAMILKSVECSEASLKIRYKAELHAVFLSRRGCENIALV